MKNQFTGSEGPWVIEKNMSTWVKGKNGVGDICKISGHLGNDKLSKKDKQNAKLISKAFELLEQLKSARNVLVMATLLEKGSTIKNEVEACDKILSQIIENYIP